MASRLPPSPSAGQTGKPGVDPARPPRDAGRRRPSSTRTTTTQHGDERAEIRLDERVEVDGWVLLVGRPESSRGLSRDGGERDAILCRRQPEASRHVRRTLARRPDPSVGGLSPDHGQAIPRQHVPTRTAPTAPAPGRTPGQPSRRAGRRARRGTATRHPDRRRRGARRRARGLDPRRGEGRRSGQEASRPRHGPSRRPRPAPGRASRSRPPRSTPTSPATSGASRSSVAV